jgi:peptidoglycan hydrolase CwlO-like protein
MRNRIPFLLLASGIFLLASCFLLLSPSSAQAQNNLTPAQRAALERELERVEAAQKEAEAELAAAQNQSASLARDIAILDAKIKVAQLNIRQKTLTIESLGKDIKTKEAHIGTLEERISRGKETLAQLMRKTNEVGSYTLPEVLLAQESVTGFFEDLDQFESVETGLQETFVALRTDKAETQVERDTLDKRRAAESDARYIIQQEEKSIKADEAEKRRLLSISRGNEATYQADLAQKRARAAQIRAQLFSLRDSAPIPFGDAYRYAVEASRKTGVRPAFLLGIFAQESSLGADATFGKHVGSCYLTDAKTGMGVYAQTGNAVANVMKPGRDTEPFITITKALGSDPYKTLISCPFSIGYGGAMGPAQFIASTWMLMVDRLRSGLSISGMPDPWNPAHAFMAASLYLADLGAGAQTYTAERNAACRYYSGQVCGAVSTNTSYGNGVMAKAEMIQRTMIDPLQDL